jgi:nucleotide-binding universal stress UspA family protein
MFTRILVAVSANSVDTVLESAVDIARKYDARIVALHVVEPTPWLMGPVDYDVGLVVEAMEAQGNAIVTRVTAVLNENSHPAETRMVTLPIMGHSVGRAIASAADTSGADLIVLGERKSGWWGWLTEDVAAEVRRHSSTPIQTVSGRVNLGSTHRAATRWAKTPAADAR